MVFTCKVPLASSTSADSLGSAACIDSACQAGGLSGVQPAAHIPLEQLQTPSVLSLVNTKCESWSETLEWPKLHLAC